MKPLVFPATVGGLVLAGWVASAVVEQVVFGPVEPKFAGWPGIEIIAALATVVAALAATAAGLARTLMHPLLASSSVGSELIAAALSAVALVLLFVAVTVLEIDVGGMAGLFFGWLLSSLVICGVSLVVVNRLTTTAPDSRTPSET